MLLKCNIKRIRFDAEITQEQLSDMTGIHISQISDYENDKIYPNTINLWKIAIALKRSVDDLYTVIAE